MSIGPSKLHAAVRDAIRRRGGGWQGTMSVVNRSLKVVQALGWRGFLSRLKGAMRSTRSTPLPSATIELSAPVPIGQVQLRVGIMAHVFYADLIDEFKHYISNVPLPIVLMVSVVDSETFDLATRTFSKLENVRSLHVRVVPNRGRDIAPLLVDFRDEILALDLLCHIHTKKSLYTGSEQSNWRTYLLESLLGSRSRVAWIIGTFQAMPDLGIVYPESHPSLLLSAHTWLSNKKYARELGATLGIEIDTEAYLDFTAGSMFWARVDSLKPLFELGLSVDHFPVESGQKDGTLHHAIERLFVQVARHAGSISGILPLDGSLHLHLEGDRNWSSYFELPVQQRILLSAIDSDAASFDVFDTLVLRPFLTPSGARQYLAHTIRSRFGLDDFVGLRERAEHIACRKLGRDAALTEIYAEMNQFGEARGIDVTELHRMELDFERRVLRTRNAVLEGARQVAKSGKRVFGLSDMYINGIELADALPPEVREILPTLVVSCDTGKRKDTGEAWSNLAEQGIFPGRWLHVGDNEHSDLQVPRNAGLMEPVHVLRPSSLLQVVPALRKLNHAAAKSRWQDQLWLGLLANRFAELGDRRPEAFGQSIDMDSPDMLGYCVLGPLVLDYLSWVARSSLSERCEQILFLSREGHALHRAFHAFKAFSTKLDGVGDAYYLTSRRASGMASLSDSSGLHALFGGTFNGTMQELLTARMGHDAAELAKSLLGDESIVKHVFLPEMLQAVTGMVAAIEEPLLELARTEREAYLAYWSRTVNQGPIAVCDLGYAGTIQSHLSRMTGRPLTGKYFALDKRAADRPLHGGSASARFHDSRGGESDASSTILRNDLLLESLMTARDGQLSHFIAGKNGPEPVFAYGPMDPALYSQINFVHQGIDDFIRDVGNVVGDEILDIAFDPRLVQLPLECLGTGAWRLPSSMGFLSVEDLHTGRGNVRTSNTE